MQLSRRHFLQYTALGSSELLLTKYVAAAKYSELQKRLNALVKQQRKLGLISSDERTAWSVYDLNSNNKLVAINENRSMQAASMVKVFVALAYFYLNTQNARKYPYDSDTKQTMENMLVKSSNSATNTMIKRCAGPSNVQRLCRLATGGLFKQLHIVEYIPKYGRTYRNKASASDYSQFLYALWHNQLPHSKELKRIMSVKNIDRIQTKTTLPDNLTIYDKTGSTGMLCGDMGIIEIPRNGRNQAYTFIGIIEKKYKAKQYSKWITNRSQAMREVSELTYNFIENRNRLLQTI